LDPWSDIGDASREDEASSRWAFFTNHFLVLTAVSGNPDLRVRDIAGLVGITERATQAILSDLAHEGYLERIRIGRRNRYKVRRNTRFRHPLVQAATVGDVLDLVLTAHRDAAVG
jgi:DNA-binding MarR family transcriptional regulator